MARDRYGRRAWMACAASLAILGLHHTYSAADDVPAAVGANVTKSSAPQRPAIDVRAAIASGRRVGSQWMASDTSERQIELTLVPRLQERARELFRQNQVPRGALVAIEPSTGRLLAYVSHTSDAADGGDGVRDVSAPAASVFKLITASALVEAGVAPDTRTCYCGGSSRLDAIHLKDNPRRDQACASLDDALGKSLNAIFAKLADRRLNAGSLTRMARAFGFGRVLPFELAPPASPIEVPGDRLEFARTAAGFWHTQMSPLHAALIAATFANHGAMPQPYAVARVTTRDGKPLLRDHGRGASRRVVEPATAAAVGNMMLRTVKDGTSRSAFVDGRGRPVLPGISVAGKTGSLSANNPYRAYSWWVGYAPADKPRIALAALVVNSELWRIKSSYVARELLVEYLLREDKPRPEVAQHGHP